MLSKLRHRDDGQTQRLKERSEEKTKLLEDETHVKTHSIDIKRRGNCVGGAAGRFELKKKTRYRREQY